MLLRCIAAARDAGIDLIQIREKDLCGRECAELTREAVKLAAQVRETSHDGTKILVNDRLDVALAEGTAGVHLGENSISVTEAKKLIQTLLLSSATDFLVGASCHSIESAKVAHRGGADYIIFGPIFATPSKAPYGAPQGLSNLEDVCREMPIPVLAIGGITLENAPSCLAVGASGLAAIRLFQDAPDVKAVIESLRNLST